MLPTVSKGRTPSNVRPTPVFAPYLRRIIKWQQMDMEYTFWQMLHLCSSPKVVYQHTRYHKRIALATCCWLFTNAYLRESLLVVMQWSSMLNGCMLLTYTATLSFQPLFCYTLFSTSYHLYWWRMVSFSSSIKSALYGIHFLLPLSQLLRI
ncbi:hypothetical protein HPP92_011319 [Vanilla planifolia]|uniref:Uncharacterized protein n=1 Tax=Vanilla planifolia TaxID=51239 RepID=A0A835V4B4_VANPL|nr:hypothetical protein HPP92_011319 [Vanilla planifolia]